MTTSRKLVLLGSLYLAQGLPYGFFTQALPVLLHDSGMSLPKIGLANLLMLPWALKLLWAPLVDGVRAPRFGRRRTVIVPLQLASAAILASLAFAATPGAMGALLVAVLLVTACSATQDVATDGLAVEVLDAEERGLANGLQVGAYRLGMILGGGLMVVVFDQAGWEIAFASMSALLLATTVPVLGYREPPTAAPASTGGALAAVAAAFARPGMARWLVVLVTFKTGEWFATGMLKLFLRGAGLSLSDIGLMLGIVGSSAALTGALAGGAAVRALGRRGALILFGSLQTLGIAAMWLAVQLPSMPMFYAVTAIEHLTSAMATASLFTAMMDFCRPGKEGTDYTVQASLVVIASAGPSALAGFSAEALGYGPHFLASAALSAAGVLAVAAYRPGDPSFALLPPRGTRAYSR